MTDKQKLRSLEQKMARLQKWYPDFDLKVASRHLSAIQKFIGCIAYRCGYRLPLFLI